MKRNLLLFVLLVVSTFAYAQEVEKKDFKSMVLTSDLGTFGRSGATVGTGLQVELGFNYEWRDSDNPVFKKDVFSPIKAKLRWAIHHKVELNFAVSNNEMVLRAWDGSFKDKYNYWSPFDIGIRAQFIESKKKVSTDASIYVAVGINKTQRSRVGDNGELRPWVLVDRPSYVTPEFAFFISHHFGKRVSLKYNLGVKWTGKVLDSPETAKKPDLYYTIALTVHALNRLDVFIEHFNYLRTDYYSSLGLNAGFKLAATPKLIFDVYGGLGLNNASPEAFTGIGLAYKLGRLK